MKLSQVSKVEDIVLNTIVSYLEAINPNISKHNLSFLCAPWVHFFTHSVIYKYQNQVKAGEISISGGNEFNHSDKNQIPGDTLAFMEYSRTEAYSRYLEESLIGFGGKIDCRSSVQVLDISFPKAAETIAYMSCLPRHARLIITIASLGSVRFLKNQYKLVSFPTNWELRYGLAGIIKIGLEQEFLNLSHWFSQRVIEFFPKSLLEYLPSNLESKSRSHHRKILFSANAWGIIDDWKVYAVVQREIAAVKLVGASHSLNYGWLLNFWQRDFEVLYLDRYLTWGWVMNGKPNVIPFSAPQLIILRGKFKSFKSIRSGVLISSAARPKHLLEYPYTPDKFELYLNTQMELANRVQHQLKEEVAIRTRPSDLGWNLPKRIRLINNNHVIIEYQSGKFRNRLRKCRLHICDNCSTTVIESFALNHPTLVLITSDYFEISPTAENETQKLIEVGVMHTTIDSLIKKLASVNFQIEHWWNGESIQEAIKNFLEHQGRFDASLMDWKRELESDLPNFHTT
jgi:putative transferase (TIGR04331 family)